MIAPFSKLMFSMRSSTERREIERTGWLEEENTSLAFPVTTTVERHECGIVDGQDSPFTCSHAAVPRESRTWLSGPLPGRCVSLLLACLPDSQLTSSVLLRIVKQISKVPH